MGKKRQKSYWNTEGECVWIEDMVGGELDRAGVERGEERLGE